MFYFAYYIALLIGCKVVNVSFSTFFSLCPIYRNKLLVLIPILFSILCENKKAGSVNDSHTSFFWILNLYFKTKTAAHRAYSVLMKLALAARVFLHFPFR